MARMRATRRWGALAALVSIVAALAAGCGKDAKPPPVSVGAAAPSPVASIQDDRLFQFHGDPALSRAQADGRVAERVRQMADLGARVIRVDLRWDRVAPSRPSDPTDPADGAYDWLPYDAIVAAAAANRVEVLFTVYGTPEWAREPGVVAPPRRSQGVAVRPADPAMFGAFATAAARRFGPRGVRRWEAWNEPNIALFLYPQFERRNGRWTRSSPVTYAALLRAFYGAVKRVTPGATIAGAVMAPVGDKCAVSCPREGNRVSPPEFLKALDAPGLRPPMDVVSHHPYPQILPTQAAVRRPFTVDLYNLRTLIDAIDGGYLRGTPVWLSEYGYNTESTAAYPLRVSPQEQAAALSDAYRRARALGPRVRLMTYYLLQDNQSWRSGLLTMDGAPKPAAAAFPLPLTAGDGAPVAPGAPVDVVGQVRPATGRTTVTVEWRAGGEWRELVRAPTRTDGTFAFVIRPSEQVTLRARWSGRSRSGAAVEVTSVDVAVPVRRR